MWEILKRANRVEQIRKNAFVVPARRRPTFLEAFKDYFKNCTLSGMRFIANEKLHITERIFWIIFVVISWFASCRFINSSWNNFQNSAISFTLETTYLQWNTNFPTVAICESDNDKRVQQQLKQKNHTFSSDLYGIHKEIVFFRGLAYFTKSVCLKKNTVVDSPLCRLKNLSGITREFLTPCDQVLRNCKWMKSPFECCDHFLPLQTEMGLCYAINSIYTRKDPEAKLLNMQFNATTGPGFLYVEVTVPSKVYVVSRHTIPFINTQVRYIRLVKPGSDLRQWYNVREVQNEPEVRGLRIRQRNCRFPDENDLSVYPLYSNAACVSECRKREMLRVCNCTSHQMPNTNPDMECDVMGMVCLYQHALTLTVQRSKESRREALFCPCISSCEDQMIENTFGELLQSNNDNVSKLELFVQSLPTERFKRNVVRGYLDMVVSMGGTLGFFVGASLLSITELIYFVFVRPYFGTLTVDKQMKKLPADMDELIGQFQFRRQYRWIY